MSAISRVLGVTIEDTFISQDEVKAMSFNNFKIMASFLEEPDFSKVAAWHSEEAQQYADEILRSCNHKGF